MSDDIRSGRHMFVKNERWDVDQNRWIQIAGTRLPDNKANRRKLCNDVDAFRASGMRARTVRYEVVEETIEVLYGDDILQASS